MCRSIGETALQELCRREREADAADRDNPRAAPPAKSTMTRIFRTTPWIPRPSPPVDEEARLLES
jgi:hypothetical protein